MREGVLFEVKLVPVKTGIEEASPSGVSPESIAPGKVPLRLGGKRPKCFFALLKSFIGATIMGFPAEPEWVYIVLLCKNFFFQKVFLCHKKLKVSKVKSELKLCSKPLTLVTLGILHFRHFGCGSAAL